VVGVDGRDIRDKVHAALALLLLKLVGDVTHKALLDLRREPDDYVPHPSTTSIFDLLGTPSTNTIMGNNHCRHHSMPHWTSCLCTNINSLKALYTSFLIHDPLTTTSSSSSFSNPTPNCAKGSSRRWERCARSK